MGATTDPIKAAQAQALGDLGYPGTQVAAMVGLKERTAYEVIGRYGHWGRTEVETPVFARLRTEQNKAIEATARMLAAKMFVQADEKLDKLNAYQAVIAGSILIDKAQLLAGLPTEITASVNVHVEAKVDGLVEALSQALLLKQAGQTEPIDITPKSEITTEKS